MDVIAAALVALCLVAVLLVVQRHGRAKRDPRNGAANPSNPDKPDTTLGEFRDLREALRPLQHTRAASRRFPGKRQ
jgi:hypothetical protein